MQPDVTDERSIEEAVALIPQKFWRLDVLVNNAAIGRRDADIKTHLQLRMDTEPAVVSAAFRSLMLKSQKPHFIYVNGGMGSTIKACDPTSAGYRSLLDIEAYRASKAALNMIALQEPIEFN